MSEDKKYVPKGKEEITAEVTNEFRSMGFNPDDETNKPLLDSMIKKELDRETERADYHKKLGKTIQQKVKIRSKLNEVLGENDEDDDDEDGEPKQPKGEPKAPDQQIDTSNLVSKDELNATLHRQKYPNLTDAEYNSIKALATADGKSFEDTIENNPMAKTYFQDANARQRLDGGTPPPSSRTSTVKTQTEDEKIAEELDKDLPEGFSSKRA